MKKKKNSWGDKSRILKANAVKRKTKFKSGQN